MARVKALLSEAPCWYCDTLYGKRREDAGYSTCEVCEQGVIMTKSKRLPFHHLVTKILKDEQNRKLGELKEASGEELMAHSAAYIHTACMIMYGLDIDKDFFKLMVQETIDSVWSVEDIHGASGPLH
tara:strand:- start:204 stop:584 length:381 start_codon:yes stop_codon:yes gene_type:complete